MAQLRIDEERLRALVPEFDDIGKEAQRALDELKATIEREGNCWGGDAAGRSFEHTYSPDAERGVASLAKTVESLREEGKVIAGLADKFDHQDREGGRRISNAGGPAGPDAPNFGPATAPNQNLPSSQNPIHPANPVPQSVPSPTGQEPGSGYRPVSRSPETTDTPSGSQPLPSSSQPVVPGNQLADSTPGLGNPFGDIPGRGAENSPTYQHTPTGTAPATTRDSAAPVAPRQAAGSSAADRNQPSTPWSRTTSRTGLPSNTPGANAAANGSRPQVSAPDSTPPRVSAPNNALPKMSTPQFPEQHAARPASKVAGKAFGAESKSPARHPWAVDDAGISENARIARELAERHDLQLIGFDTPGVDGYVVRELAAALDDVLTQYPYIDLRQIAIAESADAATRLEWDWVAGATGPEPFTRRIVLDTAMARNPDAFAEYVRAATSSGNLARGSDRRPVYSTMVRELGHGLDVAGGFRARQAAQDALIAEFTRTRGTGTRDKSASAPGPDYKQWRAQLSGYGFHNGRFDPGMAMADAFAEVQLNGPDAGPPAKVLHRLLVETARKSSAATP